MRGGRLKNGLGRYSFRCMESHSTHPRAELIGFNCGAKDRFHRLGLGDGAAGFL